MNIDRLESVIFHIYLFLIIFSPIAFGTVEPWSLGIMVSLTILALILHLYRCKIENNRFLYSIPGIIPLIIFLAYIFFQVIPLPSDIIRFISPETYNIYKDTVFAYNPDTWISFSINKKSTLMEFFRILSYASFYILSIQLLSKKETLRKTVSIVIIFISVLSFFAILQHLISNEKIFWFRKLTQGGTPFGPYVNRNHYAGLMEMIFPIVVSMLLFYKPYIPEKSFREKINEIFSLQKTNIYMLLGFSSILIATSIFLTLSRSGIVSLCLSMIFFGLLFISKGVSRRRAIIIIILSILIILSVGWFGWEPIFERFEKIRNQQGNIADLRLKIWEDSRNIIRDFPITGTGLGSFISIYQKYRTIPGDKIVDHAHNDYVEIFADGGLIAVLLCFWFLVIIFYKSYRVFRRRREVYSIYLFIGSISGIIALLMHSVTDFNLYIGANGLYFFLLCSFVISAGHTRLREGFNSTYLKKIRIPPNFLIIALGVVLVASFLFYAGTIIGKYYFSSIEKENLQNEKSIENLQQMSKKAYKASFFDPLNSRYHYAIANIEKLLKNNPAAMHHYSISVKLNPVNGEFLQRYGLLLSEINMSAAETLLRSGIKYEAYNPDRQKRYAVWLLSTGRKQDGMKIIKKALSMEPEKTREYITLLILHGLNDNEIFNILPDKVEPNLMFADYLYKTGKQDAAEKAYLHSIELIKKQDNIKSSYFYPVYNYYIKSGRYEDALKILNIAVEELPHDIRLKIAKGDVLEKIGLFDRAIEEYKKALDISPENKEAQKKLKNILSREQKN
ncbi:MAG: O-antigen ligase family protein [Nitrospirae bacterium]|nr:O-antigen ligase family protein [Nitrospirota bacterium]